MSIIATAVRHLMAAGVTGEALVEAIADMEASQPKDAAAERRRAWDRERKRAAKAAKSGGIPVESAETAEREESDPLSLSPNEKNSNPHTHTPGDITTREEPNFHVSAWLAWREKNPFPRPWWADKQTWDDWLKVRKRKGGVNTITAHNGFLRDVEKHSDPEWPPGRLLQHAVSKSWLSINRPQGFQRNDRPPRRNDEITNVYAREVARRQAERAAAEFG